MKFEKYETNKEVFNWYQKDGLTILQSTILGNRLGEYNPNFLNPTINNIDNPKLLDCKKSVDKIIEVMNMEGSVLFTTDADVDGVCAMTILYKIFTEVFDYKNCIRIDSDRHLGYGISNSVVDQINALNPDLIISADAGISDSERIKNINCKFFICTDHHLPPSEGCPNAYSIVNPHMCDYSNVCGCVVAFLLMIEVAKKLKLKNMKSLINYMDYLAVSTVADMMSLDNITNRFFVQKGLELMNSHQNPIWRAFGTEFNEEEIGFNIAPHINAVARINGVCTEATDFLLCDNLIDAKKKKRVLVKLNKERKEISLNMANMARSLESKTINSTTFYDTSNVSGVCGISAGNIAQSTGKPCAVFADSSDNTLAGSIRNGGSVNVNKVLSNMNTQFPELLLSWGGHQAACGLKIMKKDIDLFTEVFDKLIKEIDTEEPILHYDGELKYVNEGIYKQIAQIGCFGKDFPKPLFLYSGTITNVKPLGKSEPTIHTSCILNGNKAVCFNSNENFEYLLSRDGKSVQVLYTISMNSFAGRKNLQLMIDKVIK